MPVVIQPEAYADWFKPLIDPVRARAMSAGAAGMAMAVTQVGAWVNNPRRDDKNRVCLAPQQGQGQSWSWL